MVLPLLATGAFAPKPQIPSYLGTTGPTAGLAYHNFNPLAGPTTAPINQLPYAMQDGIGRNPLGGSSVADTRTSQQQMQDSQNLIGGLVSSVGNIPGLQNTPIRFAGALGNLISSGVLNPYNHVKY